VKDIKTLLSIVIILASFALNSDDQPSSPNFKKEFNHLNDIDVSEHNLSTQITLDFSQSIYFTKKVIPEKSQLKLTFPGMNINHFNKNLVLSKMNKLKKSGLASKIEVYEKIKNIPKVVLKITFEKHKKQKNGANVSNGILIKWIKMEDPNRVILDIFTKESFKNISSKITQLASNDIVQNDTYSPYKRKEKKFKKNFSQWRIVIDPGHGGSDVGAKGINNMQEKNIALSIAQQTNKTMRKIGLKSILTRSSDKSLTLIERTDFANQLKADLFISIHVNSVGKHGKSASGIETYHAAANNNNPDNYDSGTFSINLPNNHNTRYLANKLLHKKTNRSKKLAINIQNNLMETLANKEFNVINRGIKKDNYTVLINSDAPSALVEVGFLTNKKEAQRLSDKNYQKIIALGICKGVKQYIDEPR
jgi:N-acetylmuramoyl-L-alanine amidase